MDTDTNGAPLSPADAPTADAPAADAPVVHRRKQKLTPLQTVRLARTLTQAELAGLMQIAQQTLSKYETGELTPPPDQRARLAAILGVHSEVLWPSLSELASVPQP